MDSLKQYIDLYRDHADDLRTGAAALDDARPEVLKALERAAGEKSPRAPYAECSVERMLAPDYGVNIRRFNFDPNLAATFRCGVPNISTLLGVTVNDAFRPTENLLRQLPKGATVCSLAEAGRKQPELLAEYYNGLAAAGKTPEVALNTLLAQDGVLVHIADGVQLEKPIQLVNIFNAPTPLLAARRLLVVMGKGAYARILLCDHTQRRDVDYLSDEVQEIYCGEGSHLEIYSIEESSDRTGRMLNLFARQEAASHLTVCSGALSGGVGTANYSIDLAGRHAETHLGGLCIADGKQVQGANVVLRHLAPECSSRQLFKYALFGEARGAFGGKIVVAEGAVGTDAAQTNRNLLASEAARMASAPQLEIYCDDVKCSHGATTGQLDAAALFYMQTRGIPAAEARLMLTQAFMSDVIDSVGYDLIRDRLRQLVEKRLGGEHATCATCSASAEVDKSCRQ